MLLQQLSSQDHPKSMEMEKQHNMTTTYPITTIKTDSNSQTNCLAFQTKSADQEHSNSND
jgi:hypothetical protein